MSGTVFDCTLDTPLCVNVARCSNFGDATGDRRLGDSKVEPGWVIGRNKCSSGGTGGVMVSDTFFSGDADLSFVRIVHFSVLSIASPVLSIVNASLRQLRVSIELSDIFQLRGYLFCVWHTIM